MLSIYQLHPFRRKESYLLAKVKKDDDDDVSGKPRVRFSDISDGGVSTGNSFDAFLTLLASDVGSIVLGVLGLVFLVVGRSILDSSDDMDSLAVSNSLGQETRSNLLAVFACGAVLVNGISKLDVESALAETVSLVGTKKESWTANSNCDYDSKALEWTMEALMAATPAKSIVFLHTSAKSGDWVIGGLLGILPSSNIRDLVISTATPILDRFRSGTRKESYLPTLQNLPGKAEFTYLPINTQAALLVPVSYNEGGNIPSVSVLVLGANQAKSFTPRDIAWCQAAAARLGEELSAAL